MTQASAADSRYENNLTTLKRYLTQIFYPSIFIPSNRVDEVDDSWMLSPAERAILLHREFVVFCGENQTLWWDEYVKQLIYFFGECGESEAVVQQTLREPLVMDYCKPYCFAK